MILTRLNELNGEVLVHPREFIIPTKRDDPALIDDNDPQVLAMNRPSKSDFLDMDERSILDRVTNLRLAGQSTPDDISFVAKCKVLEGLDLEHTYGLGGFSQLDSPNLKTTLRELRLNSQVEDIGFLVEYQALEKLYIHNPEIRDYSALFSPNLQRTLRSLILSSHDHLEDISFLEGFEQLQTLYIRAAYKIKDFSALHSKGLARTLEDLALIDGLSISDLSFLYKYQKLRKLDLTHSHSVVDISPIGSCDIDSLNLSFCRGVADFSPLGSIRLQKSVRELDLSGNDQLVDISFLSGYRNLERLDLDYSVNILDYSPLGSEHLKKTLGSLSFSGKADGRNYHRNLTDISFLGGYERLEDLNLFECKSISDFSALRDRGLANSLVKLKLAAVDEFDDLPLLTEYKQLEELDLGGTSVRDVSVLLGCEFVKNGSLKTIHMPLTEGGMYSGQYGKGNQATVKELEDRGVNVRFMLPVSGVVKEEDKRPVKSLPDYLNDLDLRGHDIDSICKWFQEDRLWKRMPFEEQIRFVDEQSFHETFNVETAKGRKLILKVQPNRLKAEIEQAANYYLSRGFDFIAPTDQREPFEYCGLYLTVQDEISGRPSHLKNLPYHLACLAKLHAHGKEILEGAGITLPTREIPEFLEVYEVIRHTAHRSPDVSRSEIRRREWEYNESKHMLEEGKQILLHGDLKSQNRLGRYFLDLEGICTGDPTLDLAMVLNDHKMILTEDQRRAYLSIYQHFYARETGSEFKEDDVNELYGRLRGAILVRGLQSIAWNLVYINEEGANAREKLLYLPHSI